MAGLDGFELSKALGAFLVLDDALGREPSLTLLMESYSLGTRRPRKKRQDLLTTL